MTSNSLDLQPVSVGRKSRTLAISWRNGSVWRKWWIVPSRLAHYCWTCFL